jgi:threonine dehydratase
MEAQLPDVDDLRRAVERVRGGVIRTRTREAPNLAEWLGASRVVLKYETEQITGSFKERGALNALKALQERGFEGPVITASAGNHAQGVARHGTRLGLRTVVVMPETTPKVKIEATQRYGAEVILRGQIFDDAYQFARGRADQEGFALVHPFDDPDVMAGQGTAFVEMFKDGGAIDHLFVPVGGGGLIAGALLARKLIGCDTRIHGVEPQDIASLKAGLAGDPPPQPRYPTIAEGISVKAIGKLTLAVAQREGMSANDVIAASEDVLETAMVELFKRERTVVEGAAAASLAGAMLSRDAIAGQSVGIILCGGNVDTRLYSQVLARNLAREGRRARIRIECGDQPGQLNRITQIMFEQKANVLDVTHDRVARSTPAKHALLDLIVETDGEDHTEALMRALRKGGFISVSRIFKKAAK